MRKIIAALAVVVGITSVILCQDASGAPRADANIKWFTAKDPGFETDICQGREFKRLGKIDTEIDHPTKSVISSTTPFYFINGFAGMGKQAGYGPKYVPGLPTMMVSARPVMRDNQLNIQILNNRQQWLKINLEPIIEQYALQVRGMIWKPQVETGRYNAGNGFDKRVLISGRCQFYTLVHAFRSNLGEDLLLYSDNGGKRWQVISLKPPAGANYYAWTSRMEARPSGALVAQPPAILSYEADGGYISGNHNLYLNVPDFSGDQLRANAPLLISHISGLGPNQGEVSQLVRSDDQLTVVFPTTDLGFARDYIDKSGKVLKFYGNRVYARSLNLATKALGPYVYIGSSARVNTNPLAAPDNHDQPSMVVDSTGLLHVILASHGGNIMYAKSALPHTANGGFSAPTVVGSKDPMAMGLYTYASMVIDTEDRIHLVTRLSHGYRLVYLQKAKTENDFRYGSLDHRMLIDPTGNPQTGFWHVGYGHFNQRLAIDPWNRLFLYTSYIPDRLITEVGGSLNQPEQYRTVHGLGTMTPVGNCEVHPTRRMCSYKELKARDPELLISTDHGRTWKLAESHDF